MVPFMTLKQIQIAALSVHLVPGNPETGFSALNYSVDVRWCYYRRLKDFRVDAHRIQYSRHAAMVWHSGTIVTLV